MGADTEHEASETEYAVVGSTGALLYSLLSLFVWHVFKTSNSKNFKTLLFFKIMFAMCILEIPRFLCIAVTGKYDWRSLYILHIISGALFFASFSVVCSQWSNLLKLGTYVKQLFTTRMLIAVNIFFTSFDLAAVIVCTQESSLLDFFESPFFYIYMFADALKNIFFSCLLAFYGIRLIIKFYRYSKIELNEKSSNTVQKSVFSTALSRLTICLIIASACFFIRLVMLVLKSIALASDKTITTESFTLFGFFWFFLSDFIPRVLPSFTFVLLMRTKRKEIKRELQSSSTPLHGAGDQHGSYKQVVHNFDAQTSSERFTFDGEEDDFDNDDDDDYFNDDYDEGDDESEDLSLFDPPPGSFIGDANYSSPLFLDGDENDVEVEVEDDEEISSQGRPSITSRVSWGDIAKERKRYEESPDEVSFTSFKNLSKPSSTNTSKSMK